MLIAGVTISDTPCSQHISVPFGMVHWCVHQNFFGAEARPPGPSFLRFVLPMAPTTDDNARDERSVLRPNPETLLREFTLYKTTKKAIIWKRCLNNTAFLKCRNTMHKQPLTAFQNQYIWITEEVKEIELRVPWWGGLVHGTTVLSWLRCWNHGVCSCPR